MLTSVLFNIYMKNWESSSRTLVLGDIELYILTKQLGAAVLILNQCLEEMVKGGMSKAMNTDKTDELLVKRPGSLGRQMEQIAGLWVHLLAIIGL